MLKRGKFVEEIELDNGVWKCECEGFANKDAPRFHVNITPPNGYKGKLAFSDSETDFIYNDAMMEFNFEMWPWFGQNDDYEEELESELSSILMRKIMREDIEEA